MLKERESAAARRAAPLACAAALGLWLLPAACAAWTPGPEDADGRAGELRTGRVIAPQKTQDTALYPERDGTLRAADGAGRVRSAGEPSGLRAGGLSSSGQSAEEVRGRLLRMDGMSAKKEGKAKAENLRVRVVGEAGTAIAFQQGLRWRYSQLEDACRRRGHELDRIFDFRPLLLDGRVLPPVIQWAGRSVNVHSGDEAVAVDAAYRIVKPARIVSTAPIWESYLIQDYDAFDGTVDVMPKTADEKAAWKAGVEKGWAEGVEHADEVFEMKMAELVSDYRGMLRFKMLARDGMVSVPVLAEGRLGVKVGDRTLDVNETVFRITVPAEFLGRERWRPGTDGVPR